MVQAQGMNRRHRVDAAIAYALERRWDLAAEENRALLDEDPADVESANRLGKALTELGDIAGAIEAYERAVAIDQTNAIARKNLARLQEQKAAKRAPRPAPKAKVKTTTTGGAPARRRVDVATESLRTAPLIEDFGKSADLTLARVNVRAVAQVSAGDPAELELTSSGVAVKTAGGATLGHIDPRTGLRLKRMIEGGNRYSAVVLRADGKEVDVHVRETYKHPSLVGQASFLPQAGDPRRRRVAPRAYTKSSVVQYERANDDEDYDTEEEEEDVWRPRGGGFDESPAGADEDDDEDFTAELEDDDDADDDGDTAFTAAEDDDDDPIEDDDDGDIEDDEDG
jgi:hypothetical protein